MSASVRTSLDARPLGARVVVVADDLAGSRHEVLPPRMIGARRTLMRSAYGAPPP